MTLIAERNGYHPYRTEQNPQPSLPPTDASVLMQADHLCKQFVLHAQGKTRLSVLEDVSLTVRKGDCVALVGPSGTGKSTFMRSLYANYKVDSGAIWIKYRDIWQDMTYCQPHELIDIRKHTIGYVSQFLRVIPRVSTLDIVAEPLIDIGESDTAAKAKARSLLSTLNLPERLWALSPTTFSGGEKQRVNVARAFIVSRPILLLDEPTASLDAANTKAVISLIEQKKSEGCGLVSIFHDKAIRDQVSNQTLTF